MDSFGLEPKRGEGKGVEMEIKGGCLCGAVRYTAEADPTSATVCHCRDCQKFTGSTFATLVRVPKEAMTIEGALKTFSSIGGSGNPILRHFCAECGSSIAEESAMRPDTIVLNVGTFEAEPSRGYRRYQPVLARHGGKTPVGRQHVEQGLSVLRHEGVEIDERGNFLRHAVGYATDHHAAIGIADQNDIGQIRVVDNADHILNMRVEIDLTAEEVLACADTGQGRSVYAPDRHRRSMAC